MPPAPKHSPQEQEDMILCAAAKCVQQTSLLDFTMSAIAKEAGVSNGTLFNNFATKQALFDAVYLFSKFHMAESLLNEISPGDSLKRMFYILWKKTVVWGITFPKEHEVLCLLRSANVISSEVTAQADGMFASSTNKLVEAMEQGMIATIPVELLCELANANIITAIKYATAHNISGEELNQHINLTFEIFWKGIKS